MASRFPDIIIRSMYTDADWAWWRTQMPRVPLAQDAKGIIGFMKGAPVAGCILQNWTDASVEIHHVLNRPIFLRHGWLEVLGEAALGKERMSVYSLVSEDYKQAIKFDKHIGFKETGRIPNGDKPGVDLVLLTIERHEFKYGKENNDGWLKSRRA